MFVTGIHRAFRERNFSYAVQWWLFAVLALALLVGLNLKRSDD